MDRTRKKLIRGDTRNLLYGLLFISPWIIGFSFFLVYPVLSNFHLGMTQYSGFGAPEWIGFQNYVSLFKDPLFWTSLYNTFYYVILAVPLGVVVAIGLAIAMNQKVREVRWYRVILYLPSVAPVFALSMMMIWLLNPRFGLFNYILSWVHIPAINWLGDPHWSKLAIVLVAQFGAGHIALIFLAALRAIPPSLYDAASLDGANQWLVNSFLPLVLSTFFGNPFFIFLLRQFMLQIPTSLSEAARLDGANEFQIMGRIILPLTRPALVVVALLAGVNAWNDFLGPLIYLQNDKLYTLSLGLTFFKTMHRIHFNLMMAASCGGFTGHCRVPLLSTVLPPRSDIG
jgi:ABC-type sugar transport system permease subunit